MNAWNLIAVIVADPLNQGKAVSSHLLPDRSSLNQIKTLQVDFSPVSG